jgi:chloramphenicol-sensitive protein RarD
MRKGIWYAVAAYVVWVFFPIYWKRLDTVPPLQVLCHRILWSCVVLMTLILFSRGWTAFLAAVQSRRALLIYTAAAVAIAINWFVFIWAVSAGFVVQVSLGYFINPLVTVLFGVLLFREKLRPAQWAAIGLAAAGVIYLTWSYGKPPWIALTLAASFGTYGMLKKRAPLEPLHGLALETLILLVPALIYLLYADRTGQGAFLHTGTAQATLMIGAGPITTFPLLLFAAAAQQIPLTLMGVLQYINPTIQFLLGVLLYQEPFSREQLVGFGMVWIALGIFGVEGYFTRRRSQGGAPPSLV